MARRLRASAQALAPSQAQPNPSEARARIASEEELFAYVEQRFGVRIPNHKVCAGHSTPARAFADAYFAKSSVSVWKASRGFGGKSFLLSTLALTEATTLHADISVLGGSGEQATRILESTGKLWNYPTAPRDQLLSEPAKRETSFRAGNKLRALMASTRSARGPHPQRLRIDEADEMTVTLLDAAMGQPMSARGIKAQTVLSSTHHYPDGTMSEILKRAAQKKWPVHEWCWQENLEPHGWLTRMEVETKRADITEEMWKSEYDLQEPNPVGRAIDPIAAAQMWREELGEWAGDESEECILEEPVEGALYAHGADWAKEQDWTIIWTFRIDCRPIRLVAFLRLGRRPWPSMVSAFDDRVKAYGGTACHDATGVGDVIDDYLTIESEGVPMRGLDRARLFSEYIQAIEHHEIEAPVIAFARREHRMVTNKDLYYGDHPPDSVVAGAMAYRAAKHGLSGFVYH